MLKEGRQQKKNQTPPVAEDRGSSIDPFYLKKEKRQKAFTRSMRSTVRTYVRTYAGVRESKNELCPSCVSSVRK